MSARDDYPSEFVGGLTVTMNAHDCTAAMDEIDQLRAVKQHPPEDELWCHSIDICALCGDSECDGIGCIQDLNPDHEDDQPIIENIQQWIRLGRIQEQANAFLARVENRA